MSRPRVAHDLYTMAGRPVRDGRGLCGRSVHWADRDAYRIDGLTSKSCLRYRRTH